MLINFDMPITSIMFGYVTQKNGKWHNGRTLQSNMLLFVDEGHLALDINGKKYVAGKGEILFAKIGSFYKPLDTDGCSYYFYHFYATEEENCKQDHIVVSNHNLSRENYAYRFFHSDQIIRIENHIKDMNTSKIWSYLQKAAAVNVKKYPSDKMLLDSILRIILSLINSNYLEKNKIDNRLSSILLYIEQNITKDIKLTDLSEKFKVSKSYISRIFMNELGVTSTEYINNKKISVACTMLVNTDLTVDEIAGRLGFNSSYYFIRVFKKIHGITPTAYRKEW